MSEYHVNIRGEYTGDDGLRIEIPVDANDFWAALQSGRCPDCGGTWVWYEAGHVPGTRKCVGQPVGTAEDGGRQYDEHGGCGSMYTVLGREYDDDGGESAERRHMAVLRRQRMY